MDDEPSVTLRIPDQESFEDDTPTIAVPYETVTGTIDILQTCIAQWKLDDGTEPDDELWGALMGAAGRALGKLIEAYARERSADGRRGKEMMREHIARNLEANERYRERMQQERLRQPSASPQGSAAQEEQKPAGQNDGGWDF
jgi:hypothetical protein